jgi:ribose transport system permease protein
MTPIPPISRSDTTTPGAHTGEADEHRSIANENGGTWWQLVREGIGPNVGLLVAVVILIAFFAIQSDGFLTPENVLVVLRQISINAIVALAMTFVILTAGIDLGVGSVLAMSGTIMIVVLSAGAPLWLGLLVGVGVGTLTGLMNGFIIAKGRLAPFIVTLGMLSAARGVARGLSDSRAVRYDSDVLGFLGNGRIATIPTPVIIMLVWLVLCYYLLHQTRFGRHVYAVGGNLEAARFSGIRVDRVLVGVYALSGFAAGLGGVILAARLSTSQPNAAVGFELDAIAAVVLGGTSLAGGRGRLSGTMLGALIIGILNSGLTIIQVPSSFQLVIKGVVIVGAVYIDAVREDSSFSKLTNRFRRMGPAT